MPVENIIEEIHHIAYAPTATTYNKIDKLNLDLLKERGNKTTSARRK